jgi:hypothetical protein
MNGLSFPSLPAGILIAAVALGGCDSGADPTDPGGSLSVTVTAPANSVQTGLTLQLTATVGPAGSPQGVTWSTSDADRATVNASGLVLGVSQGSVTITASSTADPSASGTLQLGIGPCPPPRIVSANISASATWEDWIDSPLCFDYMVTTTLNLQAGVLTIEPGVVVGFEGGQRIRIASAGRLQAVGTAQKPIRITGAQPQRGFWGGVLLENAPNAENRIEYTTIEYAGVAAGLSGAVQRANLMVNGSTTSLLNVTLRESAAYGLFMHFDASLGNRGGNTLTANALGAAHVSARNAHLMDGGSTYSGNDVDAVVVDPTSSLTQGQVVTWAALDVPYRIKQVLSREAFRIEGTAALTLEPGVAIEFEEDMAMVARNGGKLTAAGTSDRRILLTGTGKVRGHWRGLGLSATDSRLDHVVIEYGGGAIIGLGTQRPANLQVSTGGVGTTTKVGVSNTTLRESSGYGLYARSIQVDLTDFSNNVLTQNTLGPAFVDAPIVDRLMQGVYTGNSVDRIGVHTNAVPITTSATWRDLGVPLVLDGGINPTFLVNEGGSLTLQPGVQLRFTAGMGLTVNRGALSAVGTATNPIRMEGEGPWRGINVFEGAAAFEHTKILGAGSEKWSTADEPGAVTLTTSGAATVAAFGSGMEFSGSFYGLVFVLKGRGPNLAQNCTAMAPFYIPPPDAAPDHCM